MRQVNFLELTTQVHSFFAPLSLRRLLFLYLHTLYPDEASSPIRAASPICSFLVGEQ